MPEYKPSERIKSLDRTAKLNKPIVGISTCLLGMNVRYDKGHKLDNYLRDVLGKFVEYHSTCPEVECGMGTPRESMRLEDRPEGVRLITHRTKRDLTDQMSNWSLKKVESLREKRLCGFIFKSKSPSCGFFKMKIYNPAGGSPRSGGQGLFAEAFGKTFPFLPVEEEGRLNDPGLRDNFITRVFAMHNWYDLLDRGRSLRELIAFHSRYKYLMMAHSPQELKALGSLVAEGKKYAIDELYEMYFRAFITALSNKTTVRKNVNTLQHVIGYFKKQLSSDEKAEWKEILDAYHSGLVPLIVPITLANHYTRKYEPDYLKDQVYLHPHPLELMLRNHV